MFGNLFTNKTKGDKKHHAIPYDKALVDTLKGDHIRLFEIWSSIVDSAMAGNVEKAQQGFAIFRMALDAHSNREATQLYSYLACELDAQDRQTADLCKREMRAIAQHLEVFLVSFGKPVDRWSLLQRETFLDELQKISEVLRHRMNAEEDVLYPLYRY